MAYIKTIPYKDSTGHLRAIYDNLIVSRGKLAEVHKIQSLNPKVLLAHMELYKKIMFASSSLKRYQREMIAVIVSVANQCQYCIEHHKEALLFYWKDSERLEKLLYDRGNANLTDQEDGLCWYAEALTLNASEVSIKEIETLRSLGFDDLAILDATQVIAYFNFVNRMVLGLGVKFTEEETKGYEY